MDRRVSVITPGVADVGCPTEVDAVMGEARAAGATVTREAGKTLWGGYSGVFVDPDGHPWEVAYNPVWTLRGDGAVELGMSE